MSDNGTFDSVTVFDLKTLAVKQQIKLTNDTDGVGWEPVTKTAYTNNGDNGSLTLFDPVTGKLGETIALNNTKHPEFFGADGKGRVFVALQDQNKIAVVDFKTKKLAATWAVDCQAPTGIYYEEKSDRLFTSCRGAKPVMAVIDPNSGQTVTTIPIGTNTDAVLWNPVDKFVMSRTEAGKLVGRQAGQPGRLSSRRDSRDPHQCADRDGRSEDRRVFLVRLSRPRRQREGARHRRRSTFRTRSPSSGSSAASSISDAEGPPANASGPFVEVPNPYRSLSRSGAGMPVHPPSGLLIGILLRGGALAGVKSHSSGQSELSTV